MQIIVRQSYEPSDFSPENPADIAVYFDIFRASTTLAALLSVGAAEILTSNHNHICEAKIAAGYSLVSEIFKGGADNSPVQILQGGFSGKRVFHKSTNLTTAVFHGYKNAKQVLIGAFANLATLIRYIEVKAPRTIELVPAAHFAQSRPALEDTAAALLAKAWLSGNRSLEIPHHKEILAELADKKIRRPHFRAHYWEDTEVALSLCKFDALGEVKEIGPDLLSIIAVRV